jgi:hypothetical protein
MKSRLASASQELGSPVVTVMPSYLFFDAFLTHAEQPPSPSPTILLVHKDPRGWGSAAQACTLAASSLSGDGVHLPVLVLQAPNHSPALPWPHARSLVVSPARDALSLGSIWKPLHLWPPCTLPFSGKPSCSPREALGGLGLEEPSSAWESLEGSPTPLYGDCWGRGGIGCSGQGPFPWGTVW